MSKVKVREREHYMGALHSSNFLISVIINIFWQAVCEYLKMWSHLGLQWRSHNGHSISLFLIWWPECNHGNFWLIFSFAWTRDQLEAWRLLNSMISIHTDEYKYCHGTLYGYIYTFQCVHLKKIFCDPHAFILLSVIMFGFTRMLFSCPLAYLLWLFSDHLPCYCHVVSSPAERRWPVCSSWGADTVEACKVQDWIYTCVGRLLTFLVHSLSLSLCDWYPWFQPVL